MATQTEIISATKNEYSNSGMFPDTLVAHNCNSTDSSDISLTNCSFNSHEKSSTEALERSKHVQVFEKKCNDPYVKYQTPTYPLYLKTLFFRMTSTIWALLFLNIVLLFALSRTFYHKFFLKKTSKHLKDSSYNETEIPKGSIDSVYYADLLGLKIQTYEIETADGFVLCLKRLYDPTKGIFAADKKKPLLFLSGLLISNRCYLSSGRRSLAYFMMQNNYDVWLSNNRCNHSVKHRYFENHDPRLWDWDIDDMVRYDITEILNHIRTINKSGEKISVISHSQGSAEMIKLFYKKEKYVAKSFIDKCILLAPAAYRGKILSSHLCFKVIRKVPDFMFNFVFGTNGFLSIFVKLKKVFHNSYVYKTATNSISNYLFGGSEENWERNARIAHASCIPIMVSCKLIKFWLRNEEFDSIDNQPIINDEGYWFENDTPDLLIITAGGDYVVNNELLVNRMRNIEKIKNWKLVNWENYYHCDVVWAYDLIDNLGNEIVSFLKDDTFKDSL